MIKPGERGFLAAALGAGMRAVTVPVSAQSSVAGFIFPGDRVDLVLTQTVPGGGDGEPLKVSETIMRNLRVLATDQRTNAMDEAGQPVVVPYSNVTLEVTPRIAEKIAVSQTLGSLSLSLRSLADNSAELEAAIASGEVTVPDTSDPAAEKRMLAAIAGQPNDRGTSFVTGADVSRFQRSSVPGKPQETNAPTAATNGQWRAPGRTGPDRPCRAHRTRDQCHESFLWGTRNDPEEFSRRPTGCGARMRDVASPGNDRGGASAGPVQQCPVQQRGYRTVGRSDPRG